MQFISKLQNLRLVRCQPEVFVIIKVGKVIKFDL